MLRKSQLAVDGYSVSAGIPDDGEWQTLPSMFAARYGLASTSVDGLVYAIGGASAIIDFHSVGRSASGPSRCTTR